MHRAARRVSHAGGPGQAEAARPQRGLRNWYGHGHADCGAHAAERAVAWCANDAAAVDSSVAALMGRWRCGRWAVAVNVLPPIIWDLREALAWRRQSVRAHWRWSAVWREQFTGAIGARLREHARCGSD